MPTARFAITSLDGWDGQLINSCNGQLGAAECKPTANGLRSSLDG